MVDLVVNALAFTPDFAIPLLLAALGLLINERAGVLNLGAEGFMLCGALAAVIAFIVSDGSLSASVLAAMAAGAALGVFFAVIVVYLCANQVVTGVTLVFFASGLTGLIGADWTDKAISGIHKLDLGWLAELPILGPIFFKQDFMYFLIIPIVLAVWYFLNRTLVGLNLRAVGENPQAADVASINIDTYRFLAVVGGGVLLGLAGGYLALATAKIWVDDMVHGRGWIAIALVIFSRWQPERAFVGAILFGFIEALIPRLMATGTPIPQYFLLMTPYAATLFVLVYTAVSKRTVIDAPASLGVPYVREDRV